MVIFTKTVDKCQNGSIIDIVKSTISILGGKKEIVC
jgi:hypothetical protein